MRKGQKHEIKCTIKNAPSECNQNLAKKVIEINLTKSYEKSRSFRYGSHKDFFFKLRIRKKWPIIFQYRSVEWGYVFVLLISKIE